MAGLLHLPKHSGILEGTVDLPLNKSLANRAQILAALYPHLTLTTIPKAEDSRFLAQALSSDERDLHVGAGGTTLRFATAYWATQPGALKVLSGTDALNSRPIAELVDALNALGADITYEGKDQHPPLRISGASLTRSSLTLGTLRSSQFLTALMLIGPALPNGLKLTWESLPSRSYVEMTVAMMKELGFDITLEGNSAAMAPYTATTPRTIALERDWSALAFWCEAVALSTSASLFFPGLQPHSLQGDRKVLDYFEPLGVGHTFTSDGLQLTKKSTLAYGKLVYNLEQCPDLAQALITTCFALRQPFEIFGLSTLPHKECDRLQALVDLAAQLGITVQATDHSLACTSYPETFAALGPQPSREDHRVAMSLAPLSMLMPLSIEHPEVVAKSYPDFWQHWGQCS